MRSGGRVSFLSIGAGSSLRGELDRLPRHPNALMLPRVAADTAAHVGGVGAVLEVMPAGRSQCGLKRRRPLVVGLGQPPNLVSGQVEVAEHRPEWHAGIDSLEKLLPQLDR